MGYIRRHELPNLKSLRLSDSQEKREPLKPFYGSDMSEKVQNRDLYKCIILRHTVIFGKTYLIPKAEFAWVRRHSAF